MTLKKVFRDSSDFEALQKINRDSFPPSERMDLEEIFSFAEQTDTDVLEIYSAAGPVGFIVFMKNEACGYLFFFAIDRQERSKGYGSKALKELSRLYPDLQITLDFEMIDPAAENSRQRIKRKDFYLRNGFRETGFFTKLGDEYFEVVCDKGALNQEAFCGLLKSIHERKPEFSGKLYPGSSAFSRERR